MEKDGLIKLVREEQKRKIYCITSLGWEVLKTEVRRIRRQYKNILEVLGCENDEDNI